MNHKHEPLIDEDQLFIRIGELSGLKDGWYGIGSLAPARKSLMGFASDLKANFDRRLPFPYIYVTPDGGIHAEWDIASWSVSIDVDFENNQADFYALDEDTGETIELSGPLDWERWCKELLSISHREFSLNIPRKELRTS